MLIAYCCLFHAYHASPSFTAPKKGNFNPKKRLTTLTNPTNLFQEEPRCLGLPSPIRIAPRNGFSSALHKASSRAGLARSHGVALPGG